MDGDARRKAAIKLALMDNGLITGVGNIYANESLFRAGIRPTMPARRLSTPRFARLLDAVRETLDEAIAKGGSTLRDYVGSSGEPGYFQLDYFVYGREGQPCRVCGTAIKSIRQGGRATTYCPRCQRPRGEGPGVSDATQAAAARAAYRRNRGEGIANAPAAGLTGLRRPRYSAADFEAVVTGAWRSPVAHLLWEQGVGGSNPLAPTFVAATNGPGSRVTVFRTEPAPVAQSDRATDF